MKNILILGGGGFIGKNLLNLINSHDLAKSFGKYVTSSSLNSSCKDISENYTIFNLRLSEVEKIKNVISENRISKIGTNSFSLMVERTQSVSFEGLPKDRFMPSKIPRFVTVTSKLHISKAERAVSFCSTFGPSLVIELTCSGVKKLSS